MVQVPVVTNVAVIPETVQTAVVSEAKLTGKLELADALSVSGVPSTWVGIGLKVIVWVCWLPVPLRLIVWVMGLLFNEVSVSVTVPVIVPIEVGVKLKLRLQLAPGAREELLVQSAGVPEPGTC